MADALDTLFPELEPDEPPSIDPELGREVYEGAVPSPARTATYEPPSRQPYISDEAWRAGMDALRQAVRDGASKKRLHGRRTV